MKEWIEKNKKALIIAGAGVLVLIFVLAWTGVLGVLFSVQAMYLIVFIGIFVGGMGLMRLIQKYL